MTINMAEYAFAPPDLEFQVGQEVTPHLTNSGALEHEIMFGRDVMMTDGMPNGYMVDKFESAGIEPVVTVESLKMASTKKMNTWRVMSMTKVTIWMKKNTPTPVSWCGFRFLMVFMR
jgi:hypothetical protein